MGWVCDVEWVGGIIECWCGMVGLVGRWIALVGASVSEGVVEWVLVCMLVGGKDGRLDLDHCYVKSGLDWWVG